MRKKLLMNNYSENGLLPVMDGLVCWLDGRDGKIGDTIWRDRSNNGNDASMVCDFDPTYHEWDGKKFIVKRSSHTLKTGFTNTLYDYKTLEFDFKIMNFTNYPYLFSNLSRKTRMLLQNSSALRYTRNNDGKLFEYGDYIFNLQKRYIVTVTLLDDTVIFYINGKKIITDKQKGTVEDGITYIFCDQYNSDLTARQLIGCYHSFKAYNRALTEKEVQQNYIYEQSIERS